jgi:DNA-binding transcriptional ArsR family regulator
MSEIQEPAVIPVIQETLKTLSQRMGKIAQAVALITTIVRDPYQLSNHLMRYATQTLDDTYQLEYAPEMVTVTDVTRISTGLRHVIDSCELCHTAGLMSDMNYNILLNELRQVQQFVHEKLSAYCIGQVTYPLRVPEIESRITSVSQPTLEHLFGSEQSTEKKPTPFESTITKIESETPIITIQPERMYRDIQPVLNIQKPFVKSIQKSQEDKDIRIPSMVPTKSFSGEDKKERRDAIMKTIRSKGQVTIKDISENIRGCSEKTIQRDLQELIQHGVLIREGEKRWAVYKLAMKNV